MNGRLIVLLSFLCCVLRLNAQWPEFRGTTGQGHSDAKSVPVRWSEENNIAWKTPIPGEGWSSPVVDQGFIWMSTALENGRSLRLIGVGASNGKIVHDIALFEVEKPDFKHALNSYASPTPVVSGGKVFVSFGTYGTACVDAASGKIVWKTQELKLEHENGPGSSPIVYKDKLIIPCDGTNVQYLAALDTRNGKLAWKTNRTGVINKAPPMKKAYSTPLIIQVQGKDQLIIPAAEYLYSHDPNTGAELWKIHYPGFSNVPRPIYGHGLLYICTGFGKPELWAIRPGSAGEVTEANVVWKSLKQVSAKPSPILVNDLIYFVSDNGMISCLDAKDGKVHFQERLGGDYSASPIYAGGHLYFCNQQGATFVFKPSTQFAPIATNQLANGFMASPAVLEKSLILRTKTDLYRIEENR
jgi:outer membrane protein assembly factor BamB